MRRIPPLVAALLAVLLVTGATASAATERRAAPAEKAIWGATTLGDGTSAFPVYKELGVDVFEVQLDWATTAPERPADPGNPDDPAYRWPRALDDAVAQATAENIQVAVMVAARRRGPTAARRPDWTPNNPTDYGDFLVAASRRYAPVRRWMIWGEPTRQGSYQPMPFNKKRRPAVLREAARRRLRRAEVRQPARTSSSAG